jgi:hypothetical protein
LAKPSFLLNPSHHGARIDAVSLPRERRIPMLGLMLPHCCLIFFTACGAAFGLEPLGGAVGPGWAVVLILVTPFSLEPTYRVDGCGTCDSHAGGGPDIMFGSAIPLDRCGQCNRRADVCLTLRVCRIGVIHYSLRIGGCSLDSSRSFVALRALGVVLHFVRRSGASSSSRVSLSPNLARSRHRDEGKPDPGCPHRKAAPYKWLSFDGGTGTWIS